MAQLSLFPISPHNDFFYLVPNTLYGILNKKIELVPQKTSAHMAMSM